MNEHSFLPGQCVAQPRQYIQDGLENGMLFLTGGSLSRQHGADGSGTFPTDRAAGVAASETIARPAAFLLRSCCG